MYRLTRPGNLLLRVLCALRVKHLPHTENAERAEIRLSATRQAVWDPRMSRIVHQIVFHSNSPNNQTFRAFEHSEHSPSALRRRGQYPTGDSPVPDPKGFLRTDFPRPAKRASEHSVVSLPTTFVSILDQLHGDRPQLPSRSSPQTLIVNSVSHFLLRTGETRQTKAFPNRRSTTNDGCDNSNGKPVERVFRQDGNRSTHNPIGPWYGMCKPRTTNI